MWKWSHLFVNTVRISQGKLKQVNVNCMYPLRVRNIFCLSSYREFGKMRKPCRNMSYVIYLIDDKFQNQKCVMRTSFE